MPHDFRRKKLAYLIHTALISSLVAPALAKAQDDEIEEVVVTGSYIRNSAFAQDTAMDSVTGEDLLQSGAPDMSEYIRDLSYVQNVNITSVVLGDQDGSQNNTGASFNLRGLGENSTLTLVDGVRTIDARLNTAFPEIAMERMEVVLDGGSALYGADAVAGVVNLIPIKEYDGFRFRTFYQRPEDGAHEQFRFSGLWGTSWDNGLSYVGAVEHFKQTDIMMYERPREFQASSTASSAGLPGTFRPLLNWDGQLRLLDFHGATVAPTSQRRLDPSCGTFNEGYPDHGSGAIPLPSGTVHPAGFCTFEYSAQANYAEHQENYSLYNSLSWEATDWLRFNATLNNFYRYQNNPSTFASPNPTNARNVLVVPANHPANPWGVDVVPDQWRVFTYGVPETLPDHIRSDTARIFESDYQVNRLNLRAEYDMGDTWSGYTYYSKQETKAMADHHGVSTSRLQLALLGRGGPGGDEWWSPFGSADPRSPYYVEGVTNNTREMNNWISYYLPNLVSSRNYLDVFETMATGPVFELPAGDVQVALGYQWRELEERTFQNPYNASYENFIWGLVNSEVAPDETFNTGVRALFAETEIPILDNFAAKIAVRHEEFLDQGLDATTPKVSLRYELTPEIALRASWGESFLAPTAFQTRPARDNENCGDMFSGIDELSGTVLIGGIRCSSGNPDLGPENAEITNLGFTWQPSGMLDGLEISMDYQEIEYTDRIRTLSEDDVVRRQFLTMLAATGQSEASYDSTPGSASRNAADAWLQQVGNAAFPITRFPDGKIERVLIQSANVAAFYVDLVDLKVNYTWSPSNWGTFSHRLNMTWYDQFTFQDFDGSTVDPLGKQNARTNIAPPLPETKLVFTTNWFRNNHSASMSVNWFSDIDHDAQVVDLFPYDGVFQPPSQIDGQAITDVRYAYQFDDFFGSQVTFSGGINNLFDEKPQLTGQIGGFESRLVNNWYRQYFLSIDIIPGG